MKVTLFLAIVAIAQECSDTKIKCRGGCIESVDTSCEITDGNGGCDTCIEGLVADENGICQLCQLYDANSYTCEKNSEGEVVSILCQGLQFRLTDGKCVFETDHCVSRPVNTEDCTCAPGYYLTEAKQCVAYEDCESCLTHTQHCDVTQCLIYCAMSADDSSCLPLTVPFTLADYEANSCTTHKTGVLYLRETDTECVEVTRAEDCGSDYACCYHFKGYVDGECKPCAPGDISEVNCNTCSYIYVADPDDSEERVCEEITCETDADQRGRVLSKNDCETKCLGIYIEGICEERICDDAQRGRINNKVDCENLCNGIFIGDACEDRICDDAQRGRINSKVDCENLCGGIFLSGSCKERVCDAEQLQEIDNAVDCALCSGFFVGTVCKESCEPDTDDVTQIQCESTACNGNWILDENDQPKCSSECSLRSADQITCNKCNFYWDTIDSECIALTDGIPYCDTIRYPNDCIKCVTDYYVSFYDGNSCQPDVSADPYCVDVETGGFFCHNCRGPDEIVTLADNCPSCPPYTEPSSSVPPSSSPSIPASSIPPQPKSSSSSSTRLGLITCTIALILIL